MRTTEGGREGERKWEETRRRRRREDGEQKRERRNPRQQQRRWEYESSPSTLPSLLFCRYKQDITRSFSSVSTIISLRKRKKGRRSEERKRNPMNDDETKTLQYTTISDM